MQRAPDGRRAWLGIALCVVAFGCGGDDGAASQAGGAGGAAAGSGGGGGAVADCPTARFVTDGDAACETRGGPMREIPFAAGGTTCVDKTEVTVGEYQRFLADPDKPELPASDPAAARCAMKTSHDATCANEPCQGVACDMPQACVDQCDAKSFCAWAGKKLCGGPTGAPLGNDHATLLDPTKNQWRNACSPDGREWPYGPDYDAAACNTSDRLPAPCGGAAVTASFARCQAPAGPNDQVFDMSGNLFEWVDAAQEGAAWPDLSCIIMGGSFKHYWGDADCGEYSTLDWPCDAHVDEFGFRCCSL